MSFNSHKRIIRGVEHSTFRTYFKNNLDKNLEPMLTKIIDNMLCLCLLVGAIAKRHVFRQPTPTE